MYPSEQWYNCSEHPPSKSPSKISTLAQELKLCQLPCTFPNCTFASSFPNCSIYWSQRTSGHVKHGLWLLTCVQSQGWILGHHALSLINNLLVTAGRDHEWKDPGELTEKRDLKVPDLCHGWKSRRGGRKMMAGEEKDEWKAANKGERKRKRELS